MSFSRVLSPHVSPAACEGGKGEATANFLTKAKTIREEAT